jgi:hypothetical protein
MGATLTSPPIRPLKGRYVTFWWRSRAGCDAIYAIIVFCILLVLRLGLLYRPIFPRCRNDRCSHWEYRIIALVGTDSVPEEITLPEDATGLLAQCSCGTLYLNNVQLGLVCEVSKGGQLIPFMYHSTIGRWRPCTSNFKGNVTGSRH